MTGVVDVVKKVVRKGIGFGLDAGGSAACGPLWPFFKEIVTPVVEELENRFPKLFLVSDEAEKAIDLMAGDSSLQQDLIAGFDQKFAAQTTGQQDILAFLAGLEETIIDTANTVRRIDERTGQIDFRSLAVKVDEMHAVMTQSIPEVHLSVQEIKQEGQALQADAMRWIENRSPRTAHIRIEEAKKLLAEGIRQSPNDAYLYSLRGYLEKTQSQAHSLEGRHQDAVVDIANAARFFSAALKIDPSDVSALNGMQNVFLFVRKYDEAVALGRIVFQTSPNLGSGAWDFSIALEKKMVQDGETPILREELTDTYKQLLSIMSQPASGFSSSHMTHVQNRLQELGSTS